MKINEEKYNPHLQISINATHLLDKFLQKECELGIIKSEASRPIVSENIRNNHVKELVKNGFFSRDGALFDMRTAKNICPIEIVTSKINNKIILKQPNIDRKVYDNVLIFHVVRNKDDEINKIYLNTYDELEQTGEGKTGENFCKTDHLIFKSTLASLIYNNNTNLQQKTIFGSTQQDIIREKIL